MSIGDPNGGKKLSEISSKEQLLSINPADYRDVDIPQSELLRIFEMCDAYWQHDKNPQKPHALLTSGLHSDGYVNVNQVLCYGRLAELLADKLYSKMLREMKIPAVDWVIGSPMAATTWSYEMSKQMLSKHGMAERDKETGKIVCKRFEIAPKEKVLIAEELVTTYGTTGELITAIMENCPEADIISPIAVLVNRSGKDEFAGRRVISLIKLDIQSWTKEECPLCRNGSEILRPKQNWPKLTGKA